MTTIAPVLPLHPRATRTRKPNRRPGSVPASAVSFARNLVAQDRETAASIAEALTLALREAG